MHGQMYHNTRQCNIDSAADFTTLEPLCNIGSCKAWKIDDSGVTNICAMPIGTHVYTHYLSKHFRKIATSNC